VEQQQELAGSDARPARARLTGEEIAAKRRRETIRLSRQRVLQQLEEVTNPRHREMLAAALAELDRQLEDAESGG